MDPLQKEYTPSLESRNIATLYKDSDEEEEDVSTITTPKTHKQWWIMGIIAFLVVGVGAAYVGSRVFSTSKAFQEDRVSIKIDGPRTVSSSEEVTYTLNYRNDDPNPMTKVVLSAQYPEGFTVISTDPATDTQHNNQWDRGLLKTGESGTIQIKGQWHGNPGDSKTIKASINYMPANFSSSFSHEDVLTVTLEASLLHATVQGPSQVTPGDEAVYEITYDDFSDIYQKDNVQIRLTYPKGFAFKEAIPAADFGQDIWAAPTLLKTIDAVTKQGKIKITGSFNSETPSGSSDLVAVLGYGHDNDFTPETTVHQSTQISQGDLVMHLRINDKALSSTVNVGDQLTVVLGYENHGKYPLTDINLDTTLDGSFLNWTTIRDLQTASFNHNTVSWTSARTPTLSSLKPGEKGQVSFRVSVYNRDALLNLIQSGLIDSGKELTFIASSHARYKVTPYVGGESTGEAGDVRTGQITITVNSDLDLSAQARYFNDDQSPIGSGPLPPVVGQTTSYVIQWKLANSLHDLEQVRLSTILPPDVTWVGKERTDTGTIQYDATTRTVSWVIDHMPTSNPIITGDFMISISPNASYVQKLITLNGDAGVTAQDTINRTKISLKRPALTTNLDFDPVGRGKGLVQP